MGKEFPQFQGLVVAVTGSSVDVAHFLEGIVQSNPSLCLLWAAASPTHHKDHASTFLDKESINDL